MPDPNPPAESENEKRTRVETAAEPAPGPERKSRLMRRQVIQGGNKDYVYVVWPSRGGYVERKFCGFMGDPDLEEKVARVADEVHEIVSERHARRLREDLRRTKDPGA